MGRSGGRKPRARKMKRKGSIPIPMDLTSAEVLSEARRLYEHLKKDFPDEPDLDDITGPDSTSNESGDASSNAEPEPASEEIASASGTSWASVKQSRRRAASKRRRQSRSSNSSSCSDSSTSSSMVSNEDASVGPKKRCQQAVKRERERQLKEQKSCSGLHKHLSCKDMEKLKQLSDHLLSVRQAIYMALRFSVPIQVLIVGHFHRTIPQLKSIEEAMYIADRFLRWMVSQPTIVLQLARRLCCCSTNKDSSCLFDAAASGSDSDDD